MHDPTEHVQEHIQHTAAHGDHDAHGGHAHHSGSWITAAALTAAILAAFAAISGTAATTHLTQSTHKRIDANDKWSYYQSKSLKNYLLQAEDDILEAGAPNEATAAKVKARIASNQKKFTENEEIKTKTTEEAHALEDKSRKHLETHETYELSATMFHIAIAIVAIAVVAKRRTFWYVSLVAGLIGLYFFGSAYMHAPPVEAEPKGEVAAVEAKPGGGGEKPAGEKRAAENPAQHHAASEPAAEPAH